MTTTINSRILAEIVGNHIKKGPQVQIVRNDLVTDILVPEVILKNDHISLSIKLEPGDYSVIFAAVYVNRVLMFSQTCDHKTKEDIDNFLVIPIYID